mmetsp:Transcript_127844/g.368148  ORF Transcript_127844/g.368148 Transcript_127844/m.368148 type:complete len:212 (+) Transcript_127844:3470-4105(+)
MATGHEPRGLRHALRHRLGLLQGPLVCCVPEIDLHPGRLPGHPEPMPTGARARVAPQEGRRAKRQIPTAEPGLVAEEGRHQQSRPAGRVRGGRWQAKALRPRGLGVQEGRGAPCHRLRRRAQEVARDSAAALGEAGHRRRRAAALDPANEPMARIAVRPWRLLDRPRPRGAPGHLAHRRRGAGPLPAQRGRAARGRHRVRRSRAGRGRADG